MMMDQVRQSLTASPEWTEDGRRILRAMEMDDGDDERETKHDNMLKLGNCGTRVDG